MGLNSEVKSEEMVRDGEKEGESGGQKKVGAK